MTNTTRKTIAIAVNCIIFLFCVLKEPIISYDTLSYLRADPERQAGYVVFIKLFKFLFSDNYEIIGVIFQTVFTLFCVHIFFTKIKSSFRINYSFQAIVFGILIFPFFKPLLVTVNLSSEGLSYGFYLLLIAFGIEVLFRERNINFLYFTLSYLFLVLVRGQFLFVPLLFAFVYIIKNKTHVMLKKNSITVLGLVLLPVLASLMDKTYHKLKDGFFKSSPYAYVNASTAAFYVSDKDDESIFNDEDERKIFSLSYKVLEEKELLPKTIENYDEAYKFFHDNLPKICNQTIHKTGKDYFFNKEFAVSKNAKYASAKASFNTESVCKNITKTLIKNNFNAWFRLYYSNISHGFFSSSVVLFSCLFLVILSFIKIIKKYSKTYALLFLFSSLILSNGVIIAFISHSIIRYLFYNYVLFLLIILLVVKLIKYEFKP